jgi:Ca-activated chloride channel family protein
MMAAGQVGWTRVGAAAALASVLAVPGALSADAGRSSASSAPAARQAPAFRAGVDVVSLSVTVTDPAGRYVAGLAPGQFQVFEDGVPQDVSYFSRSDVPVALALLLDTSASMEERMATAQDAAVGFARRLHPGDVAELIAFDRTVRIVQAFTGDQAALERAIRSTRAADATSLYNAVYVSLRELKKHRAARDRDIRRQAIVVVSDGADTSSLVSYDEVLDLARRSETAIYTIGLRSKAESESRAFHEAEFVLRQLARETGGRAFFPDRVEDLVGVYTQIADELASQYVLGYISRNAKRDGAWRRVVVRVDRPGATARTRPGYYAPSGR